jgi:hypothetical protein
MTNVRGLVDLLRRLAPWVEFEPGLTDREVADTEARFGLQFPPDLRELLQYRLPCGQLPFTAIPGSTPKYSGFWDWRHGDVDELESRLDWPLEGVLFDIEHNDWWLPQWGTRPTALEAAFTIARKRIAEAPRLIPIYGHRYLPDEPSQAGNPVLSVWQTDIIQYGHDLADYFEREFGMSKGEFGEQLKPMVPGKRIRVWDDIMDAY